MNALQIAVVLLFAVLVYATVGGWQIRTAVEDHRGNLLAFALAVAVGLLLWAYWTVVTSVIAVVAVAVLGVWYWQRGRHLSLGEVRTEFAAKWAKPISEDDIARFREDAAKIPERDDSP